MKYFERVGEKRERVGCVDERGVVWRERNERENE
jgi:hypothetical protein